MPDATPQPRPHPDPRHRELLDALADLGAGPADAEPTEEQLRRFIAAWDACPPMQGPRRPRPFTGRRPRAGRDSS